ncbi:MAG: HEAT repeat domain-containing protein [Ignavibacteriales bacterium]|nr:HEAT repeat domain-containing protein [Ignavibacteriales bacterium]
MGLFTSKWKHTNPDKRLEWIKSANSDNQKDKEIFVQLALNDSDEIVRKTSIQKLNDQNILAKIAQGETLSHIRETALKKITDEEILSSFAKHDKSYNIRQLAYKLLGKSQCDESLLDIALNDSESTVREKAVKNINNQKYLANIATNEKEEYSYIRSIAIEKLSKLSDFETLNFIAKNDKNSHLRESAVKKITDQNVLEEIVKNDNHELVRKAALKKIADQRIAIDIFKNDCNKDIKLLAIEKISDKNVLEAFLLAENDIDIQKELVYYLTKLNWEPDLKNHKYTVDFFIKIESFSFCKKFGLNAFDKLVVLLDNDKFTYDPILLNAIAVTGSEKAFKRLSEIYDYATTLFINYVAGYSDNDDVQNGSAERLKKDRQKFVLEAIEQIDSEEAKKFVNEKK